MNNLYDLIIIGAGPAGLSAAIYAGRAMLRTLVVDDGSGGQIGITEDVVNYPGVLRTSGADLLQTMKQQALNFGAEFIADEITELIPAEPIKTIRTKSGTVYETVGVIVATGARPRKLGFVGEEEFAGRGVGYCATCDGEFFTGKDIFVVGGGFAAAEEALFLTRYAKQVHILVRGEAFTCSKSIAEEVLAHQKIQVHFNSELKEVSGDTLLRSATIENNQTKDLWHYQVQPATDTFGVFVFIGYEPKSEVFQTLVARDTAGYITTDDDMKTSVPGIYAAGDIRPKKLRQLVTAVADGAVASTEVEKYISEQKKHAGITVTAPNSTTKQTATSSGTHLLDNDLVESLKPILERFEEPITLQVIGSNERTALSEELAAFAQEIAAISDRLTYEYLPEENAPNIPLLPALTLLNTNHEPTGIYFHGVPSGHEFNSLVIAMYNTAGPGQEVSPATKQKIEALPKATILVGATLSCTMCPDVVQASQLIARYNGNIEAHMIDISHYPEFRDQHQIMSVPATIVNNGKLIFGKKTLDEVIALVQNA